VSFISTSRCVGGGGKKETGINLATQGKETRQHSFLSIAIFQIQRALHHQQEKEKKWEGDNMQHAWGEKLRYTYLWNWVRGGKKGKGRWEFREPGGMGAPMLAVAPILFLLKGHVGGKKKKG